MEANPRFSTFEFQLPIYASHCGWHSVSFHLRLESVREKLSNLRSNIS